MSRIGLDKTAQTEAETLFAQALQLFPPNQGDTQVINDDSPILDASSGLAARFNQVCRGRLDILSETQLGPSDLVTLWELEHNTWELIAELYLDRAAPDSDGPSPKALVLNNPYTPEITLMRQALETSPVLNELLIVRDWLQRTAPTQLETDTRKGYLRFTKIELLHQLRSSGGPSRTIARPTVNSLTRELDPDATTRAAASGNLAVLDPKDAEYEKSVSQSIFHFVRAGALDKAMEVCRDSDHPWRAAALRGAKAFSWDAIVADETNREDDAMQEDTQRSLTWSGNPRRALWRKTCKAGASSTVLSPASRLVLASLAPSATTLPALSMGLQTWEDHLWARVSALLEDRVDTLLSRYGGFWSTGDTQAIQDELSALAEDNDDDDDEAAFEEHIEAALKELEGVKVNSRFDFSQSFHWAQYHIILDRTDEMFESYAAQLQEPNGLPQTSEQIQQLRFFAHFCLFLRQIGRDVPLDAANIILQAYIAHLEEERRGELVALYVGALGENAIQRYASFLSKLSIETSRHERSTMLDRARDHGLDVEAVAFSTASMIARDELKKLPAYSKELPSLADVDTKILPAERVLCRSVEWLTFHSTNYGAALRQANALMRYLLGFARIPAARELILSIPAEVSREAANHPVDGPELVHFRNFFEVWDGFAALHAVRGAEPADSTAQKIQTVEWRRQYGQILDRVREASHDLFTSAWLHPLDESQDDERRLSEITRIRQIFIPELVLRLHQELMASRHLFPANIKHAYHLSTIVADERYQLYRDFLTTATSDGKPKNRLREYMYAVRETGLAALEGGNTDPFSVLSQ
ncbi:hypothetical protein DL93DRAFT_2130809 [Clavulina sp. PMI_390]|nr:hypothetical protein DL93DRAFT_2130809 [Clavulina sp. PMI_390]